MFSSFNLLKLSCQAALFTQGSWKACCVTRASTFDTDIIMTSQRAGFWRASGKLNHFIQHEASFEKRRRFLYIARALTLQTLDFVCTSSKVKTLFTVIRFLLLKIICCRRCFFCCQRVAEGHHLLSSVSNLSIDKLPFRSRFLLNRNLRVFCIFTTFLFSLFYWNFN